MAPMAKRYNTDMARIAVSGWGNTLRYGLLWMICAPRFTLTRWATMITLAATLLAYLR
ncbi:Uncharacterised protein [Mycobacteroides abscessus subsp. abscessus]|nr:Uncharacterised protein [Mycobacteroides abscessus subsp. abscessus]